MYHEFEEECFCNSDGTLKDNVIVRYNITQGYFFLDYFRYKMVGENGGGFPSNRKQSWLQPLLMKLMCY